jgi:hypothetical protein
MPYPALNSAFDGLYPQGLQHYWKANFVTELTDDAIEAHLKHGPEVPTVHSTAHIYPINGAVHRVGPRRRPSHGGGELGDPVGALAGPGGPYDANIDGSAATRRDPHPSRPGIRPRGR